PLRRLPRQAEAGPPSRPGRPAGLASELARQAGLPDPGLARDHGEAAVASLSGHQAPFEDRQLILTLDENGTEHAPRHRPIVANASAGITLRPCGGSWTG